MDPLFQHLSNARPPEDDREERKLLGTLEDLERHHGAQCCPRIVRSASTGRNVLALLTIPGAAADSAPYDRHYPTAVPTGGGVEHRTRAVISRLEADLDVPLVPHRRDDRTETLVRGFAAGVSNPFPWAVAHLGGDAWRCHGGQVSGGSLAANTRIVAAEDLRITEGFIGFWVTLSPFAHEIEGGAEFHYGIRPGRLEAVASYRQAGPTRRDIGEAAVDYVWQPGKMFVTVAYVEAPTSTRRSRIIQERSGHLIFPARYENAGLPIISQAA